MVAADDIPWEVIIFLLIFAVVLFYFIFFQGYLTAAIYKCIIKCFLPKNLLVDFKRIQFSILSGHLLIHDLVFANLSMRIEIARLCVAYKYWSKIPSFDENDKEDDKQNSKNINYVDWIRSSHEDTKDENDNKTKKKKGIFKTIFDRKSRFKVNIDGLHVILYNQSQDAINRIETFRKIYGLEKKTTEEATEIYNTMYPSPPPQAYQLSIFMRIILPVTFKIRSMLISIGNPNLPSVLFISSKKVKGLFTMLKKEDQQHSLKQRLTCHLKEVKIRSVPNDEFDKGKFIKDSMRNLEDRFKIARTILYTNVINVIYTQDAFGCYIHSLDKDKAMLATVEPKTSIQVGLMSPKIEYGSYVDKLRSAFMRYFKPFLFINPTIYPNSFGRVKYMDITMSFFGDEPTQISLPFTTSQLLNESLIITFDNKPESTITMAIPQYVASVEENKMEVICNFVNPKIRTSLSDAIGINLEDDEGVIIKSSTLIVYYITFSPERWYEEGITKCMISFERCKMKLAPYHIDLFTDLGTDFVSTYPFEQTIDDIDFFQPSNFYVSFKLVDAKIQLLSKTNPKFESIFRIRNHQRMVIRTPRFAVFLQMPSSFFKEYFKSVVFTIQISSPTFKFILPNDNMNQFRRNCYKWARTEYDKYTDLESPSQQQFDSKSKLKENENDNVLFESDDHIQHKYVKHEFLGCSSISLSGSYKWNKRNGNRQFPLMIKIGPTNGLVSVVCIKSLLGVISNYSSSTKSHPNTEIHNKAFETYVKPEPEFPNSIMHIQLNVQIVKADVGIPFDLYDTSAFISLHASNAYLSVEGNNPYFHILIDLPSISITFNKTHFPSERFYYERIGEGMDYGNPQEVVHINGLHFAIKNSQVTKPKAVTLFSLMCVDVGDIRGTVSIYQLFAILDLALNFVYLWFSFDVEQQMEPDLNSIFLPRQMQVSVRGIFLIVDFVQYGLMLVHLPSGIIVYQDNLIRPESHKAMFVNIPTIDVHHIYQPGKDEDKTVIKKKKKKKKPHVFPKTEKSSSSHNKVFFLIDSSTSATSVETNNDFEYEEEEEEEEEERKENIAFLSQLRSVFHVTTYISLIRRGKHENSDIDSKFQMKYINEYDPDHIFFDFQSLPKNIKLPKIFNHYDVSLDDEYTLTKTMKPDPNKENLYELPIHEVFFTNQNQYIKSDVSQLWLHFFQVQRFSTFGAFHINENDFSELVEPNIDHFYDLRRDMHVIISPKTTALMNMEYIIVLMLMLKTFNLQPDSHFLSTIARGINTDLWLKKILKQSNMSLILPGISLSLLDANREVKIGLSVGNINLIKLNQINVSSQMTLFISDISLFAISKNEVKPAASLNLPSINLGKIDGDTSIHISPIIGNVPVSMSLLKIVNYCLSYLRPILQDMEPPGVDGNMDDFIDILSRYVEVDENMNIYYHPEEQNDALNENNNINNEDDDDSEDHHHHHHHHHHQKADKVRNHLPKFHLHHKKKSKSSSKKNKNQSLKEDDESSGTFLDKDSVFDEEDNTLISRYFLAYAKLCNERKSLMNFVDNFQFESQELLEEEELNEKDVHTVYDNDNENENENIRGNFASQNYQNLSLPEIEAQPNENPNENPNNNCESDGEIHTNFARQKIHQIKSETDIKLENEEATNQPQKIKRTIIKFPKIQLNFVSSSIIIKLDPISLISKGKDTGVRIVIKSIQAKLNSDIITFALGIKKPKKEGLTASKKFIQKKPKKLKKNKDGDKKFVIHFILDEIKANIEYLFLIVKSLSALVNISTKPYASISLMNLVFGDTKYVQINLGGFDFNFSKEVNHGSFCLKPIGMKVAIDLIFNPTGCFDLKKFNLTKTRKRHNFQKSQNKDEEKIKIQNEKTEKLIKSVQKFNQSETKNSINELLQGISFFFIMKEINIEAMLDEYTDQTANVTFPGARGGIFNTNNYKAFLYLMKPVISVTNFLSISLIDIYMYGFYEMYPKHVNLYTTSGDLIVKTDKDTLSKIASLVNSLLSKRPQKEDKQEATNRSRQMGRKSVANISLANKHSSSSSIEYKITPIKNKSKSRIDNMSNNAIKVVNSISDGLSFLVRFTIPSVIVDLPEISMTLNIQQPSLSVEGQKDITFTAIVKNLDLLIEKSSISINLKFVKEMQEKIFTVNNLHVNIFPSLFNHLILMKNFYVSIKKELTRQENIGHLFEAVNKNIQINVKNNFIKIFKVKDTKINEQSYEIPTITSDRYVINLNNTIISLKLTDKEEGNNHHNVEGFNLGIPSILLCLETRISELHSKTATVALFLLKNLNFEDRNEKIKSNGKYSSVKCEEANISALSFVDRVNIDVVIKSFHIALYPTVPYVFSHIVSMVKMIQDDIMNIKAAKILGKPENISDKKKLEMIRRRGSLNNFTPKSSFVIFDVKIVNTAVIFHSPPSEFSIPSLAIKGDFEKTNSTFSPQKLSATVHIKPIQTSISPNIIRWVEKLIKNLSEANLMTMVKRRHSRQLLEINNSEQQEINNFEQQKIKKPKKVLISKLMINITFLLEEIDFTLGCQPSDVSLLFTLKNLVTHFTTKSNSASFQIGELSLTTEKMNENRKTSFMPPASSFRPKFMSHSAINEIPSFDDNTDRLLSIRVTPIDGLISRELQAFSINALGLSVSNNEMEDLFTFLKIWFEPIMDIIKDLSLMYIEAKIPNSNVPVLKPPTETKNVPNKTKTKGEINIIASVKMLSISFSYSGVNGKIGFEIKPILFSKTKLSTILNIPEILLFANGFVEGTVEIGPLIFQVNSAIPNKSEQKGKRLNSAIIIKNISSNIKSYSDPLLSFNLNNIYLFFLLIPPSDQILSLIVDSPRLKMTSQAISKFKRIMSSIMDPIKDGILKTQKATINEEGPQTIQPNKQGRLRVSTYKLSSSSTLSKSNSNPNMKEKIKKKVKIEKARLDLLLEKLQFELYKYYITDKEAVRATVSRASLTVNLLENTKENENNKSTLPEIKRNMNFVFKPMSLLRLFCNNGLVVDKRSVLLIPQIIGSLNTEQKNDNISYDFITNFEDSVEASLSITDYEAVRSIIMFAIRNLKDPNEIDNEEEDKNDNVGIVDKKVDSDDDIVNGEKVKIKEMKNKKFNFKPNKYRFSPQFKIALGAKIQPDVKWVLSMFGINDEHVVPATLFQFVCLGLQDLLEHIAQAVTTD